MTDQSMQLCFLLEQLGDAGTTYFLNETELTPRKFCEEVSSLMCHEWGCGFYQAVHLLLPDEKDLLRSLSNPKLLSEDMSDLLQDWVKQQGEGGSLGGAVREEEAKL